MNPKQIFKHYETLKKIFLKREIVFTLNDIFMPDREKSLNFLKKLIQTDKFVTTAKAQNQQNVELVKKLREEKNVKKS